MFGIFDYPAEIRNIRKQVPTDERDAFMRDYKSLSNDTKTQFKKFLREANMVEASKIIGKDLSGYTVNVKNKESKVAEVKAPDPVIAEDGDNGFNERIKNILNSYQLESDPQLVADAAKKYESISGFNEMNIVEKTRKILDVSQ